MITRLSIIEGQVRGIKKMFEKDSSLQDILIQTAAVKAAFNSFSKEFFAEYVKESCAKKIKIEDNDFVDELVETFYQLSK